MPNNPDAQKKERSQLSEDIEIPPIPKQTAGAVAGAAVGSIAGPIGAAIGGVVGAVAGKAAEKRRPIAPAARRTIRGVVKSSKAISQAPTGDARPENRLPNRAKPGRPLAARRKREYHVDRRQQNHAKRRELGEGRHRRGLLGKAMAVAENGIRRSIKKKRLAAQSLVLNLRLACQLGQLSPQS